MDNQLRRKRVTRLLVVFVGFVGIVTGVTSVYREADLQHWRLDETVAGIHRDMPLADMRAALRPYVQNESEAVRGNHTFEFGRFLRGMHLTVRVVDGKVYTYEYAGFDRTVGPPGDWVRQSPAHLYAHILLSLVTVAPLLLCVPLLFPQRGTSGEHKWNIDGRVAMAFAGAGGFLLVSMLFSVRFGIL